MSSVGAALFCFLSISDGANVPNVVRRESPVGSHAMVEEHGHQNRHHTEDSCRLDFVLGSDIATASQTWITAGAPDTLPDDANGKCVDGKTDHTLVSAQQMCVEAATATGAKTTSATFLDDQWERELHPRGCRYDKCKDDNTKWCVFYNGLVQNTPLGKDQGGLAQGWSGTSICSRPKYVNGTIYSGTVQSGLSDTMKLKPAEAPFSGKWSGVGGEEDWPTQDGQDPQVALDWGTYDDSCNAHDGYNLIMSYDDCQTAARCLGYLDSQHDTLKTIGSKNASKNMEYPLGCFINSWDNNVALGMEIGKAYFNPPTKMGPPTLPRGTALCKVTTPLSLPEAGIASSS